MTIYEKAAIDNYAVGHAVELTDIFDEKYKGWLIEGKNEYIILPLHNIWCTYTFARSHIKKIIHLTNGKTVPKKFKG